MKKLPLARVEFMVHPGFSGLATKMFVNVIKQMSATKLYVTVERTHQYNALRSKLAKRASKSRKKRI